MYVFFMSVGLIYCKLVLYTKNNSKKEITIC
nr:MAG TPA: hypothetical protein [Caudoviricetes sp.]